MGTDMKKVPEQIMAESGQNRLRVELYAVNGVVLVPYPHNLINFTVFHPGPGGYFQAIRQRFLLYHQGMVARCDKRAFKTAEDIRIFMINIGRLAMHNTVGVDDASSQGLADTLVSQAHPQYGNFIHELNDDVNRYAGFARGTGTGRDDDMLRIEFVDLLQGNLIVSVNAHLLTQFAEVLNQVVK